MTASRPHAAPPLGHRAGRPWRALSRGGATAWLAVCGLCAFGVVSACRDGSTEGPASDASAAGDANADAADAACSGPACLPCHGLTDGSPCDDGDVCTAADACLAGACVGAEACVCRSDGDCAGREDGDRCNGTLYCDTSAPPRACKVLPSSVVVCVNAGAPCLADVCDPATGGCGTKGRPAGVSCDDGDPCTLKDQCDGAGSCVGAAGGCACQSDADCALRTPPSKCKGAHYCDIESHTCKLNPATVLTCPASGQPCVDLICQEASGSCEAVPRADGAACDDGDQCTAGDSCQGAVCNAGTWICPCAKDADCKGKEDGDTCNGQLFCDVATGACKVNPATVISCASVDDTACLQAKCVAKTGACVTVAVNASGGCDDGDPCTFGESCVDGACVDGALTCSCKTDIDCAAKDDADLCNGTLYCDPKLGACKTNPGTVVSCPTPSAPCTTSICQPATGVCLSALAKDGASCSDGSACTVGDACSDGVCVGGDALACPCLVDAHCGKFEDGNPCNGTLYCDKSGPSPKCLINPASVVACPAVDAGACIAIACVPSSGACAQVPLQPGSACDDGDPCTGPDVCGSKGCVSSKLACKDADPCTIDSCGPLTGGCSHVKKPCSDGNPCTQDSCVATTGACQHVAASLPCDDGDACTEGDTCKAGVCQGGGLGALGLLCVDGNACTKDQCDAKTGDCSFPTKAAGACDDGDACTAGDGCVGGVCKGIAFSDGACADGDGCTLDACHPLAGCLNLPMVGADCDDGDACTHPDTCGSVGCKGAALGPGEVTGTTCDDSNPCTLDGCKTGQGCQHQKLTHGAPGVALCDDGDPCSSGDACKDGACLGEPVGCACKKDADCAPLNDDDLCNGSLRCDTAKAPFQCVIDSETVVTCQAADGACSSATCQPATGACKQSTLADGSGCAPGGDACQTGTCAGGACKALGAKICADGNPCTCDTCAKASGCLHAPTPLDGKPCDDGDPCTVEHACAAGVCAGAKPKSCADGNACTYDLCLASKGCVSSAGVLDGKPCEDGDACTVGELCAGDACKGGQPKGCDDGNACTGDSCTSKLVGGQPSGGCTHAPAAGACDDGDLCTEKDACGGGVCAGKVVGCGDGNACTVDACKAAIGCIHDDKPLEGKLCNHAQGCVIGAICQQGLCGGGDASACGNIGDCSVQKTALYVAHGPAVGSPLIHHASSGNIWISSAQAQPPVWMVARLDAFAEQQAYFTLSMPDAVASVPAVVELPDGTAILAGGTNPKSGLDWQDWKTQIRRVSASGAVLWSNAPGTFGGGESRLLRRKDGSILWASAVTSQTETTFIAFAPTNGSKLWSVTRKGPQATYDLDGWVTPGLIEASNLDIVAAGSLRNPSSETTTKGQLMLTRMTSGGALAWVRYQPVGFDGSLLSVRERPSGELVAVGYARATAEAPNQPWLLRTDAKGNVLQAALLGQSATAQVATSVVVAGLDLVIAGYRQRDAPATGYEGTLWLRRGDGSTAWSRVFALKETSVLTTLAPTVHGYLAAGSAASTTPTGPATTTLLLRTDPWGHTPCAAVGKCAGKTEADCAVCDASKGCLP